MVAHSPLVRTLDTTLGATKKTGTEIASQVFEQTTGIATKKERRKVRSSFTKEESGLFYGDNGQELPSDEKLNQMDEQSRIDSALLYQQRQEQLRSITGGQAETIPPHERTKPQQVANVFNENKPTAEVSAQMIQAAVQNLKEDAQALGVRNPNVEEQEKQKKEQAEEEEEAREKQKEKLRLEAQIETPPGKSAGINFKRKKAGVRMRRPPKSAESKIGQGVGG
ncbi:MAG: hypothetical protein A3B43_01800 [Candidatus Levybacteria bacterium RIFCSPLOWO2_01_FULL_38_120]|nr:MAG: hypothetical protein A3B43_01800 [Candidatus Levybacteria bacterium RIFCSPLOWO2_01_FULL_38_120]